MMTDYIAIEDLSDDMAKDELTRLANLLERQIWHTTVMIVPS